MQNSQDQENPESNEARRTNGFDLGQALTAAAASLRAAGTRAQELVEGTTAAILSSLPLNYIRATEPRIRSAANNSIATETQPVNNVLTKSNTKSQANLRKKGSCVVKSNVAEQNTKENEAGNSTTGQSELPNIDFFKGSYINKSNLQLGQAEETTKGTENLKAPAVQTPAIQTPAGQSDLHINGFLKSSSIVKTNVKLEQTEETIKGTEHLKALTVQTQTGSSEIPNKDFFKGSSIVKTNLQVEKSEETTKGTENLKAPAVQTPAEQSGFSIIDLFKGSYIIKSTVKNKKAKGSKILTEDLKARPSQTPDEHSELPSLDIFKGFSAIKTNLQPKQDEDTAKGTGISKTPAGQSESRIQTGTTTEPVGGVPSTGTHAHKRNSLINSLATHSQSKAGNAESGLTRQASEIPRTEDIALKERVPSFFTEPRLSDISRLVVATSDTERRRSSLFGRAEIDFLHPYHSPGNELPTANTTSSRRIISSVSGCRILSIEPNLPSHRRTSSNLHELSFHHRKARRLSEVVKQRQWRSDTPRIALGTRDLSRTERTGRNEVNDKRSRTLPSSNVRSIFPPRLESVRARRGGAEGRATRTAQNEENKFIKAFKSLFGHCAGYRRRR